MTSDHTGRLDRNIALQHHLDQILGFLEEKDLIILIGVEVRCQLGRRVEVFGEARSFGSFHNDIEYVLKGRF